MYPKVNHFHKFEDLIILKNVKFEFLRVILSLKTMIDRTFFEAKMKQKVTLSVVVYDNYQYFFPSGFSFHERGGKQSHTVVPAHVIVFITK